MNNERIKNKYGNIRTEIDGKVFSSKREAEVYRELQSCRRARRNDQRVVEIQVHPKYPFIINENNIGIYTADFWVKYADGHEEVIDVKSPVTAKLKDFRRTMKLMRAFYGIEVQVRQ
ncbi:MAG: DUF1064 domain-containing protein [Candidatus Eisenbacteria bacterium]|nr:DUF1064 domain-containing protein [Candidatus Eisenbacteria bacterium]